MLTINRACDYLIICSGILMLGLGLLLERAGLFLYTGYIVVGVIGTVIAFRFLFWGLSFLKTRRVALFYLAALISASIMFGGWSLRVLDSSPRKHFYLAATGVKRGDSIDVVRERMAHYETWQGQKDYESFAFNAPGTSDVLIVHYDASSRKVIDLHLSLD
jgi:hypothetical protein